jgi:1-acyl-sn-glycerol-3-phosphate acyltransferase
VIGRRLIWSVVRLLSRFVFTLAFRARVLGQNRMPAAGGVLIASNHQSYLDPVLLAFALHRPVSYMARRTLFQNAAFRWLITSLNAFPVTREGVDITAMREAVNRLRGGWALLVFPEGTRTTTGAIGPIRPGILAIAERAHAVILPAVIEGAFEAWPRRSGPRPAPIWVKYGRPIRPDEYGRMSRDELTQRLQSELLTLQKELKKVREARER